MSLLNVPNSLVLHWLHDGALRLDHERLDLNSTTHTPSSSYALSRVPWLVFVCFLSALGWVFVYPVVQIVVGVCIPLMLFAWWHFRCFARQTISLHADRLEVESRWLFFRRRKQYEGDDFLLTIAACSFPKSPIFAGRRYERARAFAILLSVSRERHPFVLSIVSEERTARELVATARRRMRLA
jgi:hypothetical protein